MGDLNASYQRIIDVAAGRTLEPVSAFEKRGTAIASVYQVGDVGTTPKAISGRGAGSNVLIGYKAETERLKLGLYGDNISVYVGAHTRASGDLQIKGNNIAVFIGSFTTISSINLTQWGDDTAFVIGDRCMLSARIYTGNTDSHAIFDLSSGKRINDNKDVKIGDHVWIARDVTIGKGAEIGHDVVIGQGAYVRGTLDPNCVYAGVPARKLRDGITWSRGFEQTLEEAENSGRRAAERKQLLEMDDAIRHLTKADGTVQL